MGYTHYWRAIPNLNKYQFAKVAADFKKIVPTLEHCGVKLADAFGADNSKPTITSKAIIFNGLENCGHQERDLGVTWPDKNARGGVSAAAIAGGKTAMMHAGTLDQYMQTEVNGSWFAGASLMTRTCGGHCAHETFSLEQKMHPESWQKPDEQGRYFNFCKTAYKPYDLAVTVALVIAKHYLGDAIEVSSDGEMKDWQDAKDICEHFLGYGADFTLPKEDAIEEEVTA